MMSYSKAIFVFGLLGVFLFGGTHDAQAQVATTTTTSTVATTTTATTTIATTTVPTVPTSTVATSTPSPVPTPIPTPPTNPYAGIPPAGSPIPTTPTPTPGGTPGLPNTGTGGDAALTLLILTGSGLGILLGIAYMRRAYAK